MTGPLLATDQRLRAPAATRPFHVVLVEPEIPPNTGNIARLCGATGCPLHLVGPLGFRIDEHAVRRAGLDYWHLVEVQRHTTLADCERYVGTQATEAPHQARSWLLTGRARRSIYDAAFRLGDALVFGRESVGLPEALLLERADWVVGIPTLGQVRSLNLANAVSIVLYEALRQNGLLRV